MKWINLILLNGKASTTQNLKQTKQKQTKNKPAICPKFAKDKLRWKECYMRSWSEIMKVHTSQVKKTPSVTTTLHSKKNKRYIWNNETISLLDTNFQTCSKLTSFSFPLKVLQRVFQR